MRGMRAPVVMDKALSMRSPRISDSTSAADVSSYPPPGAPKGALIFGDPRSESESPAQEIPSTERASMQFAGVSNGESLCKFEFCSVDFEGGVGRDTDRQIGTMMAMQQSPESETNSVVQTPLNMAMPPPGSDDLMADIDWVRMFFSSCFWMVEC
jgi:hypothetical protein